MLQWTLIASTNSYVWLTPFNAHSHTAYGGTLKWATVANWKIKKHNSTTTILRKYMCMAS